MSCLRFAGLGTLILAMLVATVGAGPPAWADEAPLPLERLTQLTLTDQPGALGPRLLADTNPAADPEAAPAATESTGSRPAGSEPSWWVWAVIGAAAVGVGALIFLSSEKDPSCPAGRVCQ